MDKKRLSKRWSLRAAHLKRNATRCGKNAGVYPEFRHGNWSMNKDIYGVRTMTIDYMRGMAHGLKTCAEELREEGNPQ